MNICSAPFAPSFWTPHLLAAVPGVATDTFDRANQTPLGTADSGQVWTAANWSIIGNLAKANGGGNQQATIECYGCDGTISVELPVNGTKVGLIARTFGGSFLKIWFNAGNVELIEQIGGTPTTIGTAAWTASNGDVLKVSLSGSSVNVFVNNSLLITATSAVNQRVTRHGMIADLNLTARFNNFNFVLPPPENVTDDFNRANSTTGLGTASDGHVWFPTSGSGLGINTNKAYNPIGLGSARAIVLSNAPDCTIQVTMSTNQNGSGLSFRGTDSSNFLFVQWAATNVIQLFKKVASVNTQIGSNITGVTPTAGDVLKVVLLGNAIDIYVNNVLKGSFSEAFNRQANQHGLWGNGNGTARYEDFSITV